MNSSMPVQKTPADSLRRRVIERLQSTRTAQRELVRLELPPAAQAHFSRMSLRPAAVLVPILEDSLEVLLTQRSENLRTHAGQISLPGGSCDPADRDAIDTALREAEEEVGLQRHHVQVVGLLDDYPTGTGFRVTPVVGMVSRSASLRADGIETTALLRVPLAHLLDPAHYQAGSFVREGIELPFLEIVWREHRIWGATAGMLRNLCEKLG